MFIKGHVTKAWNTRLLFCPGSRGAHSGGWNFFSLSLISTFPLQVLSVPQIVQCKHKITENYLSEASVKDILMDGPVGGRIILMAGPCGLSQNPLAIILPFGSFWGIDYFFTCALSNAPLSHLSLPKK